jgi:hypothetical protein
LGGGVNNNMVFTTNASERMRIDSSGNVGIGTSSPTAKLQLLQSSTTAYGFISNTPTVGLTAGDFVNMAYFANNRGGSNNDGLRIVNVRDSTGSGIGNWETESYRIRRSVDQSDGSSGVQEEIVFGANILAFTTSSTERARITSGGDVLVTGGGGLGYGTGSGGAVTQATSKTTAVTLNKPTGQITMNNEALGAGVVAIFTLNNSIISATDCLLVNQSSAGGTISGYAITPLTCSSGSATIRVTNISGGSLSEAVVINFSVIKAATT